MGPAVTLLTVISYNTRSPAFTMLGCVVTTIFNPLGGGPASAIVTMADPAAPIA